jgi:hypothetical protein
MKHPIQPLEKDSQGVLRFKENKIVSHLLEVGRRHGCGLNELATMEFSQEDREQFWQLIGYSLSGYGDLSFVNDDTYKAAATMADEGLSEKDARIASLEHELFMVRSALRDPIARLYGIHPDDLKVPDTSGVGVPAARLTAAQQQCLAEILQNAYDAGGNDQRSGEHRRTFGKSQLPHMVSIMNDADRLAATDGVLASDGLNDKPVTGEPK